MIAEVKTPMFDVGARRCGLFCGALSSELDQPLSIERGQLHAAELSLERRHHSSF